jgi:hypothetical protein
VRHNIHQDGLHVRSAKTAIMLVPAMGAQDIYLRTLTWDTQNLFTTITKHVQTGRITLLMRYYGDCPLGSATTSRWLTSWLVFRPWCISFWHGSATSEHSNNSVSVHIIDKNVSDLLNNNLPNYFTLILTLILLILLIIVHI